MSRDSGDAFGQAREPGNAIAQVEQSGNARGPWRPARKRCDQSIARRQAVPACPVVEELDLHPRHVDAGGAFATASLAADAQLEGFADLGGGEVVAEASCQRRP